MFQIIGFSRRALTQDAFKERILTILKTHKGVLYHEEKTHAFIKRVLFQQGNFNHKNAYDNLAQVMGRIDGEWKVCSNKLFYLAVPPQHLQRIFEFLASSGLTTPCSPEEGWTRVIVEKPFGRDLRTAEELDNLLGKLFREEQIYRIDHYLAKEMLQNILTFRFSNNFLESSWNNHHIEKIEMRILEKIGVEERGEFYESVGALRDMGQNHLLQMLAFITMNHPASLDSDAVRTKRAELLDTLVPLTKEEITKYTFRAQHHGYRAIKGVAKDSQKETYFKMRGFLDAPRWHGVPFTIESGKKFPKARKDIIVTFKHPRPCICPLGSDHQIQNKIIFTIEPEESIIVTIYTKVPGLDLKIQERKFKYIYRRKEKSAQYVEEYEKLLLDCILGNQLLFLSTREIRAMWKFIDPVIKAWEENKVPLIAYKPNSFAITKQQKF